VLVIVLSVGRVPVAVVHVVDVVGVLDGEVSAVLAVDVPVPVVVVVADVVTIGKQRRERRAQPAPGPQPGYNAGPAPAPGGVMRFRLVRVLDETGWERPVEAFRFLVPSDWRVQGWAKWNIEGTGCPGKLIDAGMWALAPDGVTGIEVMSPDAWKWVEDPQVRTMQQQQEASMKQLTGSYACAWSPYLTAADYLGRTVMPKSRPTAQFVRVDPAAQLAQSYDADVAPIMKQLIAQKIFAGYRVDAARMLVRYSLSGRPVDEWLIGTILAVQTESPSISQMMNGVGGPNRSYYAMTKLVMGLRAPQGQLDRTAPVFEAIVSSMRINPQWAQAVETVRNNLGAIASRGAADRARIWHEAGEYTSKIQSEAYWNQQRVNASLANQFSQTVRGVQSYMDPGTGQPIELTSGYARAYSNNRGEYILSNDPLFDPAVAFHEDWRPLQPLGRQ